MTKGFVEAIKKTREVGVQGGYSDLNPTLVQEQQLAIKEKLIKKYEGNNATEILRDMTLQLMAYVQWLNEQSDGRAGYSIIKASEVIGNNLDKIHRHMEGDKISIESKIVLDLEEVRKNIGTELLKKTVSSK
ncbi:MAG TPA: hypothetical protein ENH95_06780 [Nitrosopumilus sp.]|nr:hypothetical protein [Nitrosopumilus sp.]